MSRSSRRSRQPQPDAPPSVARNQAIVGFLLAIVAAMSAVLWQLAIPLGIVALIVCWSAAQRASGRDMRSVGFAVGGLAAGFIAILLAIASVAFGGDATTDPVPTVINGIESSTPDDTHPPQRDVDAAMRCTVDLDGLRAEGTIVNHSDQPWRYRVHVVWEDADEQLGDATSLLDAVQPGASTPLRVTSPERGTAATTCRVAQIDRLAP